MIFGGSKWLWMVLGGPNVQSTSTVVLGGTR